MKLTIRDKLYQIFVKHCVVLKKLKNQSIILPGSVILYNIDNEKEIIATDKEHYAIITGDKIKGYVNYATTDLKIKSEIGVARIDYKIGQESRNESKSNSLWWVD